MRIFSQKRIWSWLGIFVLCLFLSDPALAERRKAHISRGGLGFLFPDHNSYFNVAQLSRDKGVSLEMLYERRDQSGTIQQQLTPTLAYADGKLGILVLGSREGTSFDSSESRDTIGVGIGYALGRRGNTTVGLAYGVDIDDPDDRGNFLGSINLNPRRQGVTVGVGVGAELKESRNNPVSAQIGIGYTGRKRRNTIEGLFRLNDLNNDLGSYSVAGYFTLGNKSSYLGGGYEFAQTNGQTFSFVKGRLGYVFGGIRGLDASVTLSYPLHDNDQPRFGGTLRITF